MTRLATITKGDYKDGKRGYYCRIQKVDKATVYPEDISAIQRAMNKIFAEAWDDNRFIVKFYIRILKEGDISVNGVGSRYSNATELEEGGDNE